MAHETPKLTGELREHTGTKYAARLRRAGKLPAVIYGHGEAPEHIAVNAHEVHHALHDGAHLLEIALNGSGQQTVLIKAVQYDHLGDSIIHVDLARIDLTEDVQVWVPLEVTGQDAAPGLKQSGAFLEHPMTDLEIVCRADQIPDQITVDVSSLDVNDSLTVGDLALPAGIKAVSDPDTAVASISVVTEEEFEALEEAAEGGEAAAEPEVITEREDEQGEAGEGEDKAE